MEADGGGGICTAVSDKLRGSPQPKVAGLLRTGLLSFPVVLISGWEQPAGSLASLLQSSGEGSEVAIDSCTPCLGDVTGTFS